MSAPPVGEACSGQTAKPASSAGVRSRVLPADADLVEVEGGFCTVRGIVRAVRERVHSSKRWMPFAMTTIFLTQSAPASHNPQRLKTWTSA